MHRSENLKALYPTECVYGQVRGWGKVIVQRFGFRAENMEILSFLEDEPGAELLESLSREYNVPIVNKTEMWKRQEEEEARDGSFIYDLWHVSSPAPHQEHSISELLFYAQTVLGGLSVVCVILLVLGIIHPGR